MKIIANTLTQQGFFVAKVWRSHRVFRLCGWDDGNSFVASGFRVLDVQGFGV